ncbi:MAG: Capsule biosynthesis protein CapA [Paracidovorax wautersii]|uniref:Capsule biosynthesis protein CapA n=1 Tax=Paracidovorax wautersii TaxID=1177982 RepID=A0A7V8JSB5_9BURK|nr:MAG: Capsule biosynthesis protein CapA [Paracidovorax wautersii]
MSLSHLLAHVHDAAANLPQTDPQATAPCVLFLSASDGRSRARTISARAPTFAQAWQQAAQNLQRVLRQDKIIPQWLRVDRVDQTQAVDWGTLRAALGKTKRNYFPYGIALDAEFRMAMLEPELGAHALLYDSAQDECTPNATNLKTYGQWRFRQPLSWPVSDTVPAWLFTTQALFSDGHSLHLIEQTGPYRGYRKVPDWNANAVQALVVTGTDYLARQVKTSGEYHYGWFPCFDRPIPTYNALRHASSTYALLEGWELTQEPRHRQAIERALRDLTRRLIQPATLPDGSTAAFLVDTGDEIKLGGNAVCILALVKYTELTGDQQYLPLLEQLALGIVHMQQPDGSFVHVLHHPGLGLKEQQRAIYYDGEAAFGLMRLYGLTRDARWLACVERAFEHFIAAKHWKAHDHWLSYCVNELTLYRPDERYYQFGLDNVRDHLDFVLERITTFPTLLELMMAARQMIERLQADPEHSHLLDDFDRVKFHQALEHRARYLLNGHFWPELAMFFKNPARIRGGFFIRHHAFRVRIDDVEHYLSGYVAYWKYLTRSTKPNTPVPNVTDAKPVVTASHRDTKPRARAVIAWGGDINLGRRQHYMTPKPGQPHALAGIPALHAADLAIANLECVVATSGETGVDKGEQGPFYYRARPQMLRVLLDAGIGMVSVANNHAGDYGPAALAEQRQWLDAVGVGHAGSGDCLDDAFRPALHRVGDLVVALFAIDTTQTQFAATPTRGGIAHLDIRQSQLWHDRMAPLIAEARQRAHLVLVAVHAGKNWAETPTRDEIAAAHALIDAGADAVLGTSAHVIQGIEVYRERPIIHDAGNLLFDSQIKYSGSGMFHLHVSAHGVEQVDFIPIHVGVGHSVQLQDQHARAAADSYMRQCAALGAELKATPTGASLMLSPPERPAPVQAWAGPPPLLRPEVLDAPPPIQPHWTVVQVPTDAAFQPIELGPLRLLGMRVRPAASITQRQMIWVESFWCCTQPVADDLRLDIRAQYENSAAAPAWGDGMDHEPCDWMLPTSRWQPGVIYRDEFGLRPPALKHLRNGRLQWTVGVIAADRRYGPALPPLPLIEVALPERTTPQPLPHPLKTSA